MPRPPCCFCESFPPVTWLVVRIQLFFYSSHVTARSLFSVFRLLVVLSVIMPCCIVITWISRLQGCDYSWSALSIIYRLWYVVIIAWVTSCFWSGHSPSTDYRPFHEVTVVCSSPAVLLVGELDLWKTNFDRLNTYIYLAKRTMVHLMPLKLLVCIAILLVLLYLA